MVMPGLINLDFADVRAVMSGMGTAMMGIGEAEGESRALNAARSAIDNPLLDDVSMKGARGVLINITGGYDMTLYELDEAANEIRAEVSPDANVIVGSNFDESLEGKIRISVVAAGLGDMGDVAQTAPTEPAVQENKSSTEDYIAPVVITQATTASNENLDSRPDFEGRALPAEHHEGAQGDDRISAELIYGEATEEIAEPAPLHVDAAPEPPQAELEDNAVEQKVPSGGIGGLFGWGNRSTEVVEDVPAKDDQSEICLLYTSPSPRDRG